MKVLAKKRTLIVLLLAICSVCLGFAFGNFFAGKKEAKAQELVTSESILEYYGYGEAFSAPDGVILYDDQQIAADAVFLKYPDGIMKSGKNHVLSSVGEYTVIYSAEYDGKILTAEKTFVVNELAYEFSSGKSSVSYVEDMKTTEAEKDGGLKIALAEGDSFQYNEIIDLSNSTTETPLIKLYPYTYSILAENVSVESYYTVIRLTDAYDPENYVEVSMGWYLANAALGRYHPYVVAGASTQAKSGVEPYEGANTARKIVYIDNTRYRVYYGTNDYGTMMDANPDIEVNGVIINNFDNYGMSVYYETETKRLYVKEKRMHLITDLDDASIYDRNLFEGFTTGEVILSVYGNEYVKDVAHYEIEEIDGVKGVDLNHFEIVDRIAPEISLSNDANDFYIAQGEEFSLFTATAKDKNLEGDVKAYVYYEYGSSYQSSVLVQNGKFTPMRKGTYTILYVAKDAFGNTTEREVRCICVAAEKGLVAFETAPIATAKAGETTLLSDYTLSGLNEGLYVSIYALFEGETEKISIDESTRQFFPRNVGEYTIVYEYGDLVKEYVYSYKMTVSASDNVYLDSPLLPKYLIKDAKYSFEPVYAEIYTETYPVLVEPDVYASIDGAAYGETPIVYDSYYIDGSQSVRFKYVYNGKTVYESEPHTIVDVNFADEIQMENYFVGNVDATADTDSVRLTAQTLTGVAEADFVNAVSFSQFALNFKIPVEYSSFSYLDIILTDYYDYAKTLTIRYEKTMSGIGFSVNGSAPIYSATVFSGTSHQLWYDEKAVAFVDAGGNAYEIENPFQTDKVYLTLSLGNVSGESALEVSKICSQSINEDGYDWVSATLYLKDASSGLIDFGTTMIFHSAEISDVLTPYDASAYKFYVVGPKDTYVYSDDGVLLDGTNALHTSHSVTFSEYGMYRAVYEYRDQFGNYAENVVVLYVNDRIAPEITLEKGYDASTVKKASVGKKITVADYTVSDNFGAENVQVIIRAISPDNELVVLDDMSFKVDKKGVWKVVYCAMDAEGNYATASYSIKVS